MTSLFSEWWPRTAHTAIIHWPLPSPFLPLPFPYVLRFFFISKYTFLLSLPSSPPLQFFVYIPISSLFYRLQHLFSSSSHSFHKVCFTPIFFLCGVSSVQRVNETAAFTPFSLFAEHFCCFVVVFGALYLWYISFWVRRTSAVVQTASQQTLDVKELILSCLFASACFQCFCVPDLWFWAQKEKPSMLFWFRKSIQKRCLQPISIQGPFVV